MNSTVKAKNLIVVSIATILGVVAAHGQNSSQYDKGTPPQLAVGVSSLGSYTSTELGTINLANGSLNFKIPLGTIGGRGNLSFPLTLNYSSKLWSASMDTEMKWDSGCDCWVETPIAFAEYDRGLSEGGDPATMIGAGWTIGVGPRLETKRVKIKRIMSGPEVGCHTYAIDKLSLFLPDRGEIELRDDNYDGAPLLLTCGTGLTASRGTRWHATDGSGIIFINDVAHNGDQYWNLAGTVILDDGTRIRLDGNGSMTDRNGNKITGNGSTGFYDQLNRQVTIQRNVADPEDANVILAVLVTIKGYQQTPRYYKIKTGVMNDNYRSGINPTLPVINGDWDPESIGYSWGTATRLFNKSYGSWAQSIDERDVVTELVLPDNLPNNPRSLKFRYNQFGEVAEVELPTGGKVQYDYSYRADLPSGNSPAWETGTNGAPFGITTDVKQIDRAVTTKRTYPDGVNLEGTWSFDPASQAIGGSTYACMDVNAYSNTSVLLSSQRHFFLQAGRYTEPYNSLSQHDGTHYNLWSTGVEWRTEMRDGSGNVLTATEQDWTQRAAVSWSTYPQEQPANDNRVNQSRRYLDGGLMAKVDTSYDQYNSPIEVKEYDFDQSLKRRTVTAYLNSNNGYNYQTDDSIHLLRLPESQTIYDASSNQIAKAITEYDVYTNDGNRNILTPYSSVSQHDSNYGTNKTTRGNPTRIGVWLNTTSSYIYTYPRYDILGNVVSLKDARGNVSTISFADDFGLGDNPGSQAQNPATPTYAMPTLITSPPPVSGASAHTARSQYDYSTGLLTGFRDRNNVVTQTIYSDPFNRPTVVKSALNISGIESHAHMYYAPAVLTLFGITLTKNDVLTTRDQAAVGDENLRSWTVTDGFGRTKEAWSRDPEGDVVVSTIYDALGRTKQVSNPFRPSAGESAIYTTSVYDLLGRISSVTAPDSSVVTTSYSANTVTVADQTSRKRKSVTDALGRLIKVHEDPDNLDYQTTYEYDTLDNLKKVIQDNNPQQPQQAARVFTYDSLKRLMSATNPESGTISYQYDEVGNLVVKTDARVSTHFAYDAFSRVTRRWYNGSSSPGSETHVPPSGVGTTDEANFFYDGRLPTGAPSFTLGAANGRPTAVTYGGFTSTTGDYSGYDVAGRNVLKIQRTGSLNYQMSAGYIISGAVTSLIYPSGNTVNYGYNTAGRNTSFTGNLGEGGSIRNYSTELTYSSLGGLTKEKFGTTPTPIYNKLFYNSRGQLAEILESTSYTGPTDATWDRGKIVNSYSDLCSGMCGGSNSTTAMTDNNGNLKKQSVYIPSETMRWQQFSYDSLNRLQWAREILDGGSEQWKQTFIYDRYGNRKIDTNSAHTYGVGSNNQGFALNKAFDVNQATNQLTAPSGQTGLMEYDAVGNLKNDTYTGAGNRTYDAENKITSAWGGNNQAQLYKYDASGQRIKRTVDNVETWAVYGIGGEMLAEYPANGSVASPQKEYGYRNGQLLVTAEAASGPLTPQNVTWTNAVGVTVSGNSLTKTASDNWGNGGASSTQSFASGDGYVEFTASETSTSRMIGLSNGDANQDYTDIDFAAYLSGGSLCVFEGGTSRGCPSTFVTGDTIRVAVESGVVKYRKNGTEVYTSSVAPSYPLLADAAIWSNGGTIGNVILTAPGGSGGGSQSTQNVTWGNSAGVSVSGNSLTKTAADNWGNAGASSTQSFASGDGYVEFTASETSTSRMIGLSNGDANQDYTDIDFAAYLSGGSLCVFEGGTSRGCPSTFVTGDTIRVAVESGVVKYRKNGTEVYSSGVTPNYPLLADSAIWSNGGTINNAVISGNLGGGGSGSSGGVRWLVVDQLGTPRMIFDESGSLANMKRHDYLPFGEELAAPVGGRSAGQGYSGGDGVRQQFTVKERDVETGLDYFLARYYSNVQGRFTSVDPENAGADESDPQSWNGYSYTRNTPTILVDPDGREFQICYGNDNCQTYSDKQFAQIKADATKLGTVFKNGAIYNEVNGELVVTGNYTRTDTSAMWDQVAPQLGARLEPVQKVVTTGAIVSATVIAAPIAALEVGAGTVYSIASTAYQIGKKIEKQINKRGWSRDQIDQTISQPHRKVPTRDTRHLPNGSRMNDPATAYVNKDGSYVIRNDRTGDIVQISDKNNPNWQPPF